MDIHPKADLFPMLDDEQLAELAADIKKNGLSHPIVLAPDGVLVDGRNRHAACLIAGVEPAFTTLAADVDVEAFIISQNFARRHMTAGARAMVAALMYPEPEAGGRGKKAVAATGFPMVNQGALSHARKVAKLTGHLVGNVLSGALSLDQAYAEAKKRDQIAQSNDAKMARLLAKARDLADLVIEKRMTVEEAIAALDERERKIAQDIEHGKEAVRMGMVRFLSDVASILLASKLTDEKLLDKARLDDVIKAAHQLEAVVVPKEED
jgi:hypothetical protein